MTAINSESLKWTLEKGAAEDGLDGILKGGRRAQAGGSGTGWAFWGHSVFS